jgi:protein-arginine kinase activator protein McsA
MSFIKSQKCTFCKNPAVLVLTQILGSSLKKINLCSSCVYKRIISNNNSDINNSNKHKNFKNYFDSYNQNKNINQENDDFLFKKKSSIINKRKDMLSNKYKKDSYQTNSNKETLKCFRCRLEKKDFEENKILGCANCYSTFYDFIKPIIENKQTKIEHIETNKSKHKKDLKNSIKKSFLEERIKIRILKFKEKLKKAIKKEEYEIAAILRDKIINLEKKNKN